MTVLVLLIWVAAFVGALLAAILGWLQTTNPFNPRQFGLSCINSLVGAALIAVGWNYVGVTNIAICGLLAFLAGGGWIAGGSRVVVSISTVLRTIKGG